MLVAAPVAMQFEGFRGKAYYDPAHILTQCYGETRDVDPAVIYTKDECGAKLRARMAADYAPALAQCLPQLVDMDRVNVFGALLDAAYNAGPAAVCKSRMAVAIRAGDWAAACSGFNGWYTTALNRKTGVRTEFPGLVTRRKAEAKLCATVPAPPPVAAPVPAPSYAPTAAPVPAPAPAPVAPEPVRQTWWQRLVHWLFG